MDPWVWWLIAGCALGAGEMLGMDFFLAPFAGGAFAAALVSLIGAGGTATVIVFVAVTALLFGIARPVAKRHVRMPPELRTGTAALVGRSAMVLEPVTGHVGSVKIDGEVWSARSYEDDRTFEAGERVNVIEIRGATALVSD